MWVRLVESSVILLDDSAHYKNHVRIECKSKQIGDSVRQLDTEYRPNRQLRVVALNAVRELIPHDVQAAK